MSIPLGQQVRQLMSVLRLIVHSTEQDVLVSDPPTRDLKVLVGGRQNGLNTDFVVHGDEFVSQLIRRSVQ